MKRKGRDGLGLRRKISVLVLVVFLALPFARPAHAQCGTPPDCTSAFGHDLWQAAQQYLEEGLWDDLGDLLLSFITDTVNDFMTQIFGALDQTEGNLGQWFENFAQMDFIPSLKSMTRQLNTDHIEQARMFGALYDAQIQTDTQTRFQDMEHQSRMELYPSEATCSTATVSGGLTRADRMGRAMTEAMDNELTWAGLNKKGRKGEGGAAEMLRERVKTYRDKFCDPTDNGGEPGCSAAPPDLQNADVLPFNTILDRPTIRYDETPELKDAVQSLAENLCFPFPDDPIPPKAIDTASGHTAMLAKRSNLSRRNVCMHSVHWMAGKRAPGSVPKGQVNQWVMDIRTKSLLDPIIDISANPSWNEIMHTFTKARYQQPRYYADMAAETDENLEREKIVLDIFYLMQLRDLYELNEQIAAMLASEVAQLMDAGEDPSNAMREEPSN